jgi:uncharacterized YkwD family protein/spore coat assembly protein SafA
MKKSRIFTVLLALILSASLFMLPASATTSKYVVAKGDTIWKIAEKYHVGVTEIISVNPQVKNPDLIYPGQVLSIPLVDPTVLSFEDQVATLVNSYRAKYGLAPLRLNWQLSRMARIKSQDMRDLQYFSHTSPTYGSPFDMMEDFGFRYHSAGENIAMGQSSPQAVMNAWINSSGHRANILSRAYTQIGVGYVPSGHYWTQEFIG